MDDRFWQTGCGAPTGITPAQQQAPPDHQTNDRVRPAPHGVWIGPRGGGSACPEIPVRVLWVTHIAIDPGCDRASAHTQQKRRRSVWMGPPSPLRGEGPGVRERHVWGVSGVGMLQKYGTRVDLRLCWARVAPRGCMETQAVGAMPFQPSATRERPGSAVHPIGTAFPVGRGSVVQTLPCAAQRTGLSTGDSPSLSQMAP